MNGQILWGVGLTITLTNTVTKHTIKSLLYLILKRIEFWLTVNFQVQVKILLCRPTNQCILLILKEGSGTSNNRSHNCLVVKYPIRWARIRKVERRAKCDCPVCRMLPAGAFRGATLPRPPHVTALVNHHLCKVGIFKWQPRHSRKGIPGIFLLKIPTTFHNRWEFELIHYWTLRSTEYSERAQQKFSVPQFTQSVIADSKQ